MSGALESLGEYTFHKVQLQVFKLSGAGSTSRLLRVAKEVFPDPLFLRSAGMTHIYNHLSIGMVPF